MYEVQSPPSPFDQPRKVCRVSFRSKLGHLLHYVSKMLQSANVRTTERIEVEKHHCPGQVVKLMHQKSIGSPSPCLNSATPVYHLCFQQAGQVSASFRMAYCKSTYRLAVSLSKASGIYGRHAENRIRRGCSSVGERMLCMYEAPGSIPGISKMQRKRLVVFFESHISQNETIRNNPITQWCCGLSGNSDCLVNRRCRVLITAVCCDM